MTKFSIFLQLIFKLLLKSKEGWFWSFGFALIMATGLGLMYNAIDQIPEQAKNDIHTYSLYVSEESPFKPLVQKIESEHFIFIQKDTPEAAKAAFEEQKLSGYGIIDSQITLYGNSNQDPLYSVLKNIRESMYLQSLQIPPDHLELKALDTAQKVTGMDHMIIGMSLLAPFIAGGAYTRIRGYSKSSQFKRFTKGKVYFSQSMAIGLTSFIFSFLSGLTVLAYGIIVFKINSHGNFNFPIFITTIALMALLSVALRSLLNSIIKNLDKTGADNYVITFLGFLSGVYIINIPLAPIMNYNPITLGKYLMIYENFQISLPDFPLTKGFDYLAILSLSLTAIFLLLSAIIRRLRHD